LTALPHAEPASTSAPNEPDLGGGQDMITVYETHGGVLMKRNPADGIGEAPLWIDMVEPSRQEDEMVAAALGVSIPTREEMQQIEASSRLYSENGVHYMTATFLVREDLKADTETEPDIPRRRNRWIPATLPPLPTSTQITFVLTKGCLVTVRYKEPRAFPLFLARNQKGGVPCHSPANLLVNLIEAIIDREADRIERLQAEVDRLSNAVFQIREPSGAGNEQRMRNRHFDRAVRQIGREGEITSRCRECLQSLDRVLTYLGVNLADRPEDKFLRQHIKSAQRDVRGLNDHVNYLSNKVQFLLDATLGMIGLEQSSIIKFYTVVSVAMMPPTLLASIWGMNFKQMPDLSWEYGYPVALGLMVASAVLPFWWFRRKGWL
jgi:magnesium transporter